MAVDDTEARKARAQALRRQIESLKRGSGGADQSSDSDDTPPENAGTEHWNIGHSEAERQNYRSWIDRRMHEIDKKE